MRDKIDALRHEMKKQGIDGFFIPRTDAFQGEYVPPAGARLEWLTGFTGSAGCAVVTQDKAAFFTDGRYTVQAPQEVDETTFDIFSTSKDQHPTPTMSPYEWMAKSMKAGMSFGIDPWLHSVNEAEKIEKAARDADCTLIFTDVNPLDAAWHDRPPLPADPAVIHPLVFSGVPSQEKRAAIAKTLKENAAQALAITLPEDICWLLNIRGNDVPCTPFVLSYAILHDDATLDWFVHPEKTHEEIREWIGAEVRIHALESFAAEIKKIAAENGTLWIDPASSPAIIHHAVKKSGGNIHAARNPVQMAKACKNTTEIAGTIAAHIRDGLAMTRFLAQMTAQGAPARHDEISASDLLEKIRSEGLNFKGLSFDTISGAGANGAIVHYRATEKSKKPLLAGPVYLLDSGAQYLDGTTDITRTLAVDTPDEEMRDRYTRVLKGHIAVARAVFSEGTTGHVIDALARAPLQEIGLDYAHGTGHGVGSYLSVHEGPCGISPLSKTVPLMPGMILSNEPGFYKNGAYGIRIENLVLVIDTNKKDKEGKRLFSFKTLTLAPIDKNLIEKSLLTTEETAWLDAYHAEVREKILPLATDAETTDFLLKSTTPL